MDESYNSWAKLKRIQIHTTQHHNYDRSDTFPLRHIRNIFSVKPFKRAYVKPVPEANLFDLAKSNVAKLYERNS